MDVEFTEEGDGKVMVVLVDDDNSFRSALAENLRDDGHEVVEYSAPSEVPLLKRLGEVRGVLITDYEMPGANGLVFADTFHTTHPSIPVVMITASPTPNLVAQAAARTFVRLLRKPLDYNDLRTVLSELP